MYAIRSYYVTQNVVNNGDNTITVPTGVSSFTITVSTIDDLSLDATSDETLILTVDSISATGHILDNDIPSVTSVYLTTPTVSEGNNLVYSVTLSTTTNQDTEYSVSLLGGTALADVDFNATPTFSDAVVLNGDNTITVPMGVSSFTATIATITDGRNNFV